MIFSLARAGALESSQKAYILALKVAAVQDAGTSCRAEPCVVPNGYVEGWIEKLKPTMANLSALNLLDKTYVCTSRHMMTVNQ